MFFNKKAIIIYIKLLKNNCSSSIEEIYNLSKSLGIKIIFKILIKILHPHYKYFINVGKLKKIKLISKKKKTNLIILNHVITPSQERNLKNDYNFNILNRTKLILNIFIKRSKTKIGKLQSQLASLKYMSTRLIHNWTHLERQKGGLKILSGPGETQLETDRRLLNNNILFIYKKLKKIEKNNIQKKYIKLKKNYHFISLVGYTNAGKSTLFNNITKSNIFVSQKLFSTLDTKLNKISKFNTNKIILSDTIGFIKNLPNELIESFKTTLKEICYSSLIIHILDVNDLKNLYNNENYINLILKNINAKNIKKIRIMNKIDKIKGLKYFIEYNKNLIYNTIWLSAKKKKGIFLLYKNLFLNFKKTIKVNYKLLLPKNFYWIINRLYCKSYIINKINCKNNNIKINILIKIKEWLLLCKLEPNLKYCII
ncbi:GTPase HflX [Candidatus Annandia adelgestsuga]|uniref:GTPase HflX n=1 Tax=Candidatus Annandia adelgestsuga TaxID=1302411 RepID=A0A3S5HNX1_9ENTR|nr:GTPase HflX [Candidatus Annandia adelgestsuga]AZP36277.1 GTPase HflX [Candidatus Annandia adelgestsuga]